MANDININIIAKNNASGPLRKAGEDVKALGDTAEKTGKKAKQNWKGLGDLFTGLLPRGVQSTLRAFKGAQRQIGRLSKSFKVLKGAIASTGLGLLVVALGEIVANWDSIKGAIIAASDETERQLELAKEQIALTQENLELISLQENILKLQGNTEEDILHMRMDATDEAIAAQKTMIELLKVQKEETTNTTKTAKKWVQGILEVISYPVTGILRSVDLISEGLVKIGALSEATNLADTAMGGLAELLGFDPEEVEKEGDASIKAAEEALLKLENARAGYYLREEEEKKRREKQAQDDREKAAKQAEADAEYRAEQRLRIERELEVRAIQDEEKRALRKREIQYEDDQAALKERGATLEDLLLLEKMYYSDLEQIQQEYAVKRELQQTTEAEKESTAQAKLADELFMLQQSEYDQELIRLQQQYDERIAIAGDDEGLIRAATEQFLKDQAALEEEYAQAEIERQADIADAKIRAVGEFANATLDVFGQVSELSEANAEQQKNLAIADVLLNQAMAMASAVAGASAAAASTGPGAPFTLGAYIISMVGTIVGSFASIKNILDQANAGSSGVGGGGGGARRTAFGGGEQQLPMPARLSSPDQMRAFVVQTELQGMAQNQQRLNQQTAL